VPKVDISLAGQPLHKREEGSGVMPIHELYLRQVCSPIRLLHVITNPISGARSFCSGAVPAICSDWQPGASAILHTCILTAKHL
jgi:hypothetical protein